MNRPADRRTGNLGTFAGVFTPSILTILGIILFLRMGYVVGGAGGGRVLIIVGLANVISILTSLSLSATATNLKVKGGGDYYLISRTLGLEFGGAIGVVLFLAQSVSIAFYCIGFGEALVSLLSGSTIFSANIIAALAVLFLFIFAWLGADWATKFQYVVMVLLIGALLSFFVGGFPRWEATTFLANWQTPAEGPGFWILFALFFPAVTGFTQGVSMSGDLKDPGKSLPLGTFMAVGLSMLVYLAVAVIYSGALPNSELAADYGAMKKVARYGFLIDAGVIAATLSSAMASFLGAPRILQSLSSDRIFPFLLPFAKGDGENANPRRAVLLAAAISLITISLGKLNLIAQVVSMFFLISYGLLNYATFYEARADSPSFRPRFKWFNPRLSLLGFITCLGAMLAIDVKNGIIAASVLVAIYQYLKRTAGPARWADSSRSHRLQRVRENLLAIAEGPEHDRDWRPQLIAFTNDTERRPQLLRFASWIEGRSGLTTAVRIIEGSGMRMRKPKKEAEEALSIEIKNAGSTAFPLVVVSEEISTALSILPQVYGIGPFRANTVLINWMDQLDKGISGIGALHYVQNLKTLFRQQCNLIVLNEATDHWENISKIPEAERRIDVWWWGDLTSRLMLLLAYLMKRSNAWDETTIRLLVCRSENDLTTNMETIQQILEDIRIDASPEILDEVDTDVVIQQSKTAAMTFFPFRFKQYKIIDPFKNSISRIMAQLPAAAFVKAAEDIDLDAEPEEGIAGEMAAALDAFSDAEKKAKVTEKDAEKAKKTVSSLEEKLHQLETSDNKKANEEEIVSIVSQLSKANEAAEKARRRAARAQAKAEDAAALLQEMTGEVMGDGSDKVAP
jgi:amino acid transporter